MSKTIKFFTVLAMSLFLFSCGNEETTQEAAVDESLAKIEVLNFHSTHRCMTCNNIEANTKYTLNTYFKDELDRNKISSIVVNVDEEENLKIAEKFEAAGTALFLNVIKNGEETKIDLTDFAFMDGNDQEAFSTELKAKIETELKTL